MVGRARTSFFPSLAHPSFNPMEHLTMKLRRIPQEVLMDAIERSQTGLDNPGFCLACGEEQEGCEPDARGYECESCGAHRV